LVSARLGETGEAWGKRQREDSSGRTATLGICMASNARTRATPGNGARPPDNFPSRWLRLFPEMTIVFSNRFPGCLLRFLAKDTDMPIQLPHPGAHQRNEAPISPGTAIVRRTDLFEALRIAADGTGALGRRSPARFLPFDERSLSASSGLPIRIYS
jgi:hypothetical protein